jgi:hypothetical protein
VSVFNSLSATSRKSVKLTVLQHLIRYAASARLLDLLQPYLAGAASWPVKWDLTPKEAGDLFLLIAQSFEVSGAPEEAQAFLVRFLSTLEGASEAALTQARPWAKMAMLNFVNAAAIGQKTNLPRLNAVSIPPPPLCLLACLIAVRHL